MEQLQALGVLTGFGIDANYKISSSMPNNPHDLKIRVVQEAIKNQNIRFDRSLQNNIIAWDPMIPAVAGIATGIIQSESRVMLAGEYSDGCSSCIHVFSESLF